MPNNARAGKREERRLARKLSEAFPEAERNFEDREGKGHDLDGTEPFKFQLKYGKSPSVYKALEQAVKATEEGEYGVGVAKFRKDSRTDPEDGRKALELAVLRLDDLIELLEAASAEGIF